MPKAASMKKRLKKKGAMSQSAKKTEIWLHLHFPHLALDAQLDSLNTPLSKHPRAIILQNRQMQRVHCQNNAAKDYGIEPQMSLSTALALCPNLQTYARDIAQEQAHLKKLALIAYSFCPTVVLQEHGGIGLELSRCEKLYGNYSNLLKQLQAYLLKRCSEVFSGLGHSLLAARLTTAQSFHTQVPHSQQLNQQMRAMALEALDVKRAQKNSFVHLGLDTIGDLLDLPKEAVHRRFNADLLSQIDGLFTTKINPKMRFTAPEIFDDCLQNPQGLYTKEALYAPMGILLERFCRYLKIRHLYCRNIRWHFSPLLGQTQSLTIQLSQAQNHSQHFFALSRLQLERLDLAHSIEKISLYSDQFVPAEDASVDFFEHHQHTQKAELLDQLVARLGDDAISQPGINAEYLPEQANVINSAIPLAPSNLKKTSLQPLWLLDPLSVQQRDRQPYWRQPLTLLSGPERVCGNWWHSEQQRDYYLAHDSQGTRYWLYWELQSQRWFIHGLFA